MSRIGNKVIQIPAGVTATVDGGVVTVTGPKGTLKEKVDKSIKVEIKDGVISFVKLSKEESVNAKQGLYRAKTANMVKGVTEGFKKSLIIVGVGYKASVNGNKLVLNLGLSHDVKVDIVEGITVTCPSATEVVVAGIDKELVGQFASNIRDLRPVEPYHGYGIHYSDEHITRKVGKVAKKAKK